MTIDHRVVARHRTAGTMDTLLEVQTDFMRRLMKLTQDIYDLRWNTDLEHPEGTTLQHVGPLHDNRDAVTRVTYKFDSVGVRAEVSVGWEGKSVRPVPLLFTSTASIHDMAVAVANEIEARYKAMMREPR